jgi:hypothetical protein
MSCRKGRHGQTKGNSDARLAHERSLSQRVFWRNDKRMMTPTRAVRYGGISPYDPKEGRYHTVMLRRLRALRGVGPARRMKPASMEFKHYG